jgi:hypothetical protein
MNKLLLSLGFFVAISAVPGGREALAQSGSVHYGDVANCAFLAVDKGVNRLQCLFMPISGSRTLHIEYVSGECISTPTGSFTVKEFQIVTIANGAAPSGATRIPYQLSVPKNSLNSGFVSGSFTFSAGPTSLYANAGTPLFAYVDLLFPSLLHTFESNIAQCTVSLSGRLAQE